MRYKVEIETAAKSAAEGAPFCASAITGPRWVRGGWYEPYRHAADFEGIRYRNVTEKPDRTASFEALAHAIRSHYPQHSFDFIHTPA